MRQEIKCNNCDSVWGIDHMENKKEQGAKVDAELLQCPLCFYEK